MDKIFSRKRIRLPYPKFIGIKGRKKNKILFDTAIILIIAVITFCFTIKAVSPIIDKACSDVARAKATLVSNNMATEVMKKYTYEDFVSIYKDSNGNITMIQSNIITINEVTSDVAVMIQNSLLNNNESIMNLKLR